MSNTLRNTSRNRAPMFTLTSFVLTALISAAAAAQTATPSPTASPTPTCTPRTDPGVCAGANKVQLSWLAKDPLAVRVFVSATNCPTVPSCADAIDGELVSVPPLSLTVTDAAGYSVNKTITDPGVNSGGCPGGKDSYRGADRLRLIYGAATTLVAKLRVPQTQPMPSVIPPLTFTVRDACGAVAHGVVNTCVTRTSLARTDLKCF